jgi:hypothetical protein
MLATDQFVRHVLQFQDEDGYPGIYSKELRYGDGDLWMQTCLLRGLLAYAELTRNPQVFNAVVRCVDGILHAYGPGKAEMKWGEGHDLMIVDVLERLYDLTGDTKYREFGVHCYQTWSEAVKNDSAGHDDDVSLDILLDKNHPYYLGHCDRTAEHVRVPLWLWMATGEQAYDTATRNAFDRLDRYAFISGSIVSNGKARGFTSAEFIANEQPDSFEGEYEYCTSKEVQIDFESALQKIGTGADADRVELTAHNGEVALQFGPLLFAQPIEATANAIKDYPLPNFHDTYYEPANDTNVHLALKASNQATASNFIPVHEKAPGSPPPSFTRPGIKLHGTMIDTVTQKTSSIELVPMGSAPTLRRLTFPVVSGS